MINPGSTLRSSKPITHQAAIRALGVALVFAVVGIIILINDFYSSTEVNLQMGEVAPQAITAPQQITYASTIETEAARERARNAVPPQFTPPDPKVTREQVSQLRKIFDFMETVRSDPYGSLADKFEWIDAISDLNLSDTTIDQILILNDQDWNTVRKESLRLLDDVMRDEIRETQVFTKRRELPNKVALDIPQNQSDVIVDITSDLIKPNTFPDEVRTEAERQAASQAVEPVLVTIEQNELVIPAGRVIGSRELEKLDALGLQQPKFSWIHDFATPIILMMLITVILAIYLIQYTPKLVSNTKSLSLLALLILIFVLMAKLIVPTGQVIPYLFPIAALTMMTAILIEAQLAFIVATIVAFLAGYIAPERPEQLVIYYILSGWTGVLVIGRDHRVNNLLWAGMYVALVNTSMIIIFNFSAGSTANLENFGVLVLEGLLNGIFSAGFALIGLFAIGNLFGITTSIQLLELGRPTQPLLRQLLLKAPGTYHHSLMVSNLAEQAAERIGANSLLVRVMAYYHDIGKMQRPYFFIENQPEGMSNVHEKLDPQISAKIIISHVTDGLDLANKYRLPPSIKDGIAQHQGTGLVRFFYYQATEAAKKTGEEVDEAKFRYPGPKPQIKETGILMLADVSETTVRALKPQSAAEIDEIVQKSIAHHLDTGQLDECDLTISDLRKIRTAFVDILQGIHHPRIKYPEQVKAEEEAKAKEKETPEKPGEATEGPTAQTGEPASPPASPQALKPISRPSAPGPGGLVQQE